MDNRFLSLKYQLVYLCIKSSQYVSKVSCWYTYIHLVSKGDDLLFHKVEVAWHLEHYLRQESAPSDGVRSTVKLFIYFKTLFLKKFHHA